MFGKSPFQHPMAVGIVADELSIANGVELPHQRMAFRSINRMSLCIMAVKLEERAGLGIIANDSPSCLGNAFERAVQQYALCMRIVLTFIIREPAQFGVRRKPLQMAVYEDVAMILGGISDPHKRAPAGDGAMVEERGSAAQQRVASTVDTAVLPVTAAIGLQRVTIADNVDILEVVALAVHQQSLGLALAVGTHGHVLHDEVAAVIGSKGGAP